MNKDKTRDKIETRAAVCGDEANRECQTSIETIIKVENKVPCVDCPD